MARPRKNTVDYFPHVVDHGKTLFVLENQHGNDGYAFWFKLLEELGRHENHLFDLRDEAELEYFASRARTSSAETLARLDLLARIGAIDPALWAKRLVWSQRFVDNIADAYRKRKSPVPTRPRLAADGSVLPGQSGPANPQTKAEESKENQTTPHQPAPAGAAAGEEESRFSTLVRTQFEALYCRSFGHDYPGLPTDSAALGAVWQALHDKPDRVEWVATCLATLFARPQETRPRSLAYCARTLVEDYQAASRRATLTRELQTHRLLVRKLGEFITDPAILRRLFQKHGAARLQHTYDQLAGGRHAYSYSVFRDKFFERLRQEPPPSSRP